MLSPVSKAVAAAIASIIVGYCAKYGITLDPATADAVNIIVLAVVTGAFGFAVTYIAPKNK